MRSVDVLVSRLLDCFPRRRTWRRWSHSSWVTNGGEEDQWCDLLAVNGISVLVEHTRRRRCYRLAGLRFEIRFDMHSFWHQMTQMYELTSSKTCVTKIIPIFFKSIFATENLPKRYTHLQINNLFRNLKLFFHP